MTRDDLISKTVKLVETHSRIALQWATNVGKSKAAIEIANYIAEKKFHSTDEYLKVLLIVAETAHKSNWKTEFEKWHIHNCSITIECYASLKNYENTDWDLIVFDEAHHLNTDLRLEIVKHIHSKNILLLSATLSSQEMTVFNKIFGEFAISKVTFKQAIDWNILPKPKIFLIPCILDNKSYTYTIIEQWGKKENRITHKCKYEDRFKYLAHKEKYPDVILKISCTQLQKYLYITEQFEYWKKRFFNNQQEYIKNKWLQKGSERKRFLGDSKTREAYQLLRKIKNKRFICFCSSISQAEILGAKNAIHSKNKYSLSTINAFNDKKINRLYAVGMLQEGQNLTDIEIGIIIQLDGKERAFIQKFGRSLRAEDPIQFIFYYKDTRDEEYLKNALEGIEPEYITEIEDITNLEIL